MSPQGVSFCRRRNKESSALVITLAALVLICALLLLFFDQSTLNRQISFSSAGQYRADQTAHTSVDTIIGDLRTEIAAGSTNNGSIYVPTNNFTVVPSPVNNQGFTNLVAQSASSSNFWTGSYYDTAVYNPVRSAPGNSTMTASANGRSIKINQWNKPGLLGDPGAGDLPTVPTTYTDPPDWVLITRQGAVTNALTLPAVGPGAGTLSDKSATNPTYVIGRYAYTIYNEGGLLDVNVAGYPGSVSGTDFTTKRGLLPQVDLGNIPGVSDANALVQWRNAATAASASAYTNYVFTATNGFTTVAPGDQAFVSRQDLINYAKANPGVVATSALQYLGTSSRELNAPTFAPSATRPTVGAQDNRFNPSLVATSVAATFTRINGTTAVAGEPLLKSRFPLSRLGWLTPQGVSTTATGPTGAPVTAADVMNSFGLKWSTTIPDPAGGTDSGWVYNHGAPAGTIYKLSDIAGTREPDFFELLQAGILYGSLGQIGPAYDADDSQRDGSTFNQIIQIGANLIDQYDTDSTPTLIQFNIGGDVFSGVENLPYIYRVFYVGYRPTINGTPSNQLQFYFIPEIWNPHGSPASNSQRFRFMVNGEAQGVAAQNNGGQVVNPVFTEPPQDMSTSAGIIFDTKKTAFGQPTALSDPSADAAADNSNFSQTVAASDTIPSGNGLGVYIGSANAPYLPYTTANTPLIYQWVGIQTPNTSNPITFELQYETSPGSNQWVTYTRMRNLVQPPGNPANNYTLDNHTNNFTTFWAPYCAFRMGSDPRTERFSSIFANSSEPFDCQWTIRPMTTGIPMGGYTIGLPSVPAGWTLNYGYVGGLEQNTSPTENSYGSSLTYYSDPDGVVRPAEGAYANGSVALGGHPLATPSGANPNSRPIVLNRPFRSVGDMGYACRDMPWKNLDFFTTESADSALLDLFCLNESPTDSIIAGKVDLNTGQLPVLEALLNGAIKSDPDGTTLTSAQAISLVASLRSTITSSGPLLNRSDLVNRWIGSLSNSAYGNGPDTFIKLRRESAVRALADVGMTRTWNLLIDVVAQSGRYAPGATNLNQFTVEGEKRYWVHLALDRFTGEVIAEYFEPVFD